MQVMNRPFFFGSPFAPGYVPKNSSKERFSIMMTTTCWILWIPVKVVAGFDAEPKPAEQAASAPQAREIARKTKTMGRGASRTVTVTLRMLGSLLSRRLATLTNTTLSALSSLARGPELRASAQSDRAHWKSLEC